MFRASSRSGMGLCAAVLLLVLVPRVAPAANILVNPGYETGVLNPWSQISDLGGPTNWTVTNTEAHTGTYSATDQGNKLVAQYFTPVPTSDISLASVWVKNPNSLYNAIYLEYSDSTYNSGLFATTGSWQYVDFTSWLASGKSLTAVGVWGYVAGGTDERTYVDDWVVDAVPEPASLTLLAMALLVGRRRR